MTPFPSRAALARPFSAWRRLACTLLALGTVGLSAQTADRGTITGRVFNPATSEYVRDAEVSVEGAGITAVTEAGGYYRLRNVPAGEVNVIVNYTGYAPASAKVTVAPGAGATQDFELTGAGAAPAQAQAGDVVTLDAYVVSTEREGNSKAIMEQKAATNIKTVVAADSFGEIAEGNIGEFLKFMPGVVLDYVETDTRAARMGGMEARYGAVTLDGNSVANAGGNSRQFEFEAMSINNIEAIEVNKTLNADMPADSPAGSINLRTKSALDRKGQRINFMAGLIGNEYEHSLKETPRHDDAKHAKSRPSYSFDYSNTFLDNRLGVSVNGAWTSVFKPQYRESMSYDYTSATAVARGMPLVNQINFKDGVKLTNKGSLGLKLDFQPFGPHLRFSLTSSYIDFNDEIANRNLGFQWNAAQNTAGSTPTRIVVAPNTNSRILQSGGTGNKQIDTSNLALGFIYKGASTTIDGQVSYSRARLQNGADHMGAVDRADMNLRNIGFIAERGSEESSAWTFTQTSGPDWNNFANYTLANVVTGRTKTKTQQFNEQINVKYVLPFETPTFIKTGLYHQVMVRDAQRMAQGTFNWVGTTVPQSLADFRISPAFGGNIRSLPVPDKTALYNMLFTNPSSFTQTESQKAGDLDAILGGDQDVEEDIWATYLMANTRLGQWTLQAGFRFEDTATTARTKIRVPDAENPFPANTINRINYRWGRGSKTEEGGYDHLLPSAAAIYRFNEDILVKLGYHQAIKRAPLDQLAGQWDIDESAQRVSVPNANLDPETSQKFSAMLEYYFEPAGTASIHVFHSTLENSAERTDWMPASEFGFGNDPIFFDWEFRGWENIPGKRTIKGVELDYKQQLTFLRSEYLRGITVFANFSVASSNPRPNNFVPRNAAAGVYYRYRSFNAAIKGTWTPDVLTGSNSVSATSPYFAGDLEYRKERFIFDIDIGFKLTRRLDLFASARNAFNEGNTWYFKDTNGRIRQAERYGGQWTLGVRGRY